MTAHTANGPCDVVAVAVPRADGAEEPGGKCLQRRRLRASAAELDMGPVADLPDPLLVDLLHPRARQPLHRAEAASGPPLRLNPASMLSAVSLFLQLIFVSTTFL
jgi:hypothetical protein